MTRTASPRPNRRSLIATLLSGAFVLSCSTAGAAHRPDDLFARYEAVTGTAQGQTVVPAFLLGGPTAEIAVLHIDESQDRRLEIFGFVGDAWEPVLEATLRPGVSYVDVARIGEHDRLLTLERGRVNWFDPESSTERPLVEIATSYDPSPAGLRYGSTESTEPFDEGEIPQVDITHDLNHDGLDDLILPDVDGFRVFVQQSDGAFADAVKVGPPEPYRDQSAFDDERSYGEVGVTALTLPWYLSRVHELDYDGDGRGDLVFWNEDHFDVYLQGAKGTFPATPETFTVDVPFDSDGMYSLLFAFSEKSAFSMITGLGARMERTMLRGFRDVNGDGIADLLTQRIEGRSVLRLRSGYAVYYGAPTSNGTSFSREASSHVRRQAKAPPVYYSEWLEDFDGDGRIDVLAGGVKTSFLMMIRAILNTSITVSAELHRFEDGVDSSKPSVRRKMRVDVNHRGGRDAGFFPPVLVGDVNGDGSSDLLVGKSREELHVYLGGPNFLAGQPTELAVTLPGDERNSRLVDLNRDGKQDVLMHHASTTEPHRLTMLIAK